MYFQQKKTNKILNFDNFHKWIFLYTSATDFIEKKQQSQFFKT